MVLTILFDCVNLMTKRHVKKIYALTYNTWWIEEIRPKVFKLIEQDAIKVKLIHQLGI